MGKKAEAQDILKSLGLPPQQQNEISAFTLLALCGIEENDPWTKAHRHSVGISKEIMKFTSEVYNKEYAENTRETFRRRVLHQFIQAGIVEQNPDDKSLPTNESGPQCQDKFFKVLR